MPGLLQLARAQCPDSPAFIYFERILVENLSHLRAITAPVPGARHLYSAKAATFPFLLAALHRHGIAGFDASSASEAHFIHRVLGRRAKLYVTAPALTAEELAGLEALEPACVHVDSLASLRLFLRLAPALPLGLRLNPAEGYSRQALHAAGGKDSRLGIPLADLPEALALCRSAGRTRLGLHFHVTCEAPSLAFQAAALRATTAALRRLDRRSLTFSHLDVGGGWLPPSWDFAADHLVPSLPPGAAEPLRQAVGELREACGAELADDFALYVEPGDFLVCSAAVLLARVLERRHTPAGDEHLMLDTNINHFPNLLQYGSKPQVLLAPAVGCGPPVRLSGSSCLGGDVIAVVDPGGDAADRGNTANGADGADSANGAKAANGVDAAGGGQSVRLSGSSCLGGKVIAAVDPGGDAANGVEADAASAADAAPPPESVVFIDRGSYEYVKLNFFNGRLRPGVHLLDEAGALCTVKQDGAEDLIGFWRERAAPFPAGFQSFPLYERVAIEEKGLHYYHPQLRRISAFELDAGCFPVPESLRQALVDNFGAYATTYGRSLGHREVRERIARYENRFLGQAGFYTLEHTAMTLGAANGVWLTLGALLTGEPRRLLVTAPNFFLYAFVAARLGIPWQYVHKPRRVPAPTALEIDPWSILPDLADVEAAIDRAPDAGALAISEPGLPYGIRTPTHALRRLADRARAEGWALIVDETLADVGFDGAPGADWSWLDQSHPVIRFKSVSKTFGLAGLRLGYLCATEGARRLRPGADLMERIADLADQAYSSPPAVMGPVLTASLDILEDRMLGRLGSPHLAQFLANLAKARERLAEARRVAGAWGIPHVVPEAGLSLMVALTKLPRADRDSLPFFRALVRRHSMFLELGGIFSQSLNWSFTAARLGLGRGEEEFHADLEDFCRFYDAYPEAEKVAERVESAKCGESAKSGDSPENGESAANANSANRADSADREGSAGSADTAGGPGAAAAVEPRRRRLRSAGARG